MIFYSSQRQCIHSIHPLTTLRLRLIVTIFTERREKDKKIKKNQVSSNDNVLRKSRVGLPSKYMNL